MIDKRPVERLAKPSRSVAYAGDLAFGIGKYHSPLNKEQRVELALELPDYINQIVDPMLVDCMDDRPIVEFANGLSDSDTIRRRVVYQQPGGTVLHFTKSAVAANLAAVASAKDFTDAYMILFHVLTGFGWQDSGHKDCGASKNLKKSVENPLQTDILMANLDQIIGVSENYGEREKIVKQNEARKLELCESGFYDNWSYEYHEEHLSKMVPRNFSALAGEHNPCGFLLIQNVGDGFMRNSFIEHTGRQVFSATTAQWGTVIDQLCPIPVEKERMLLALVDDLCSVCNVLIAPDKPGSPGMPLFVAA
jgi:hypothetical protein